MAEYNEILRFDGGDDDGGDEDGVEAEDNAEDQIPAGAVINLRFFNNIGGLISLD